jgi:hypothetical protein
MELATRTSHTAARARDEIYSQMVFSGTQHLKLAIHDGHGTFNRLDEDVIGQSTRLLAAANHVQPAFKKLRVLLGELQGLVIRHGKGKRLTLLNRDKQLKVFVREDGADLPPEFENLFA